MKPPRSFGDDGISLVELLVTIVLLGVGVTALLVALLNTIRSSDTHRQQAQVSSVLNAAAESLVDPVATPYQNCATATNPVYRDAFTPGRISYPTDTANWGSANVQIVAPILYWGGDAYGTTCFDTVSTARLQQITLEVTSPNGRASQRLTVVKRGA